MYEQEEKCGAVRMRAFCVVLSVCVGSDEVSNVSCRGKAEEAGVLLRAKRGRREEERERRGAEGRRGEETRHMCVVV